MDSSNKQKELVSLETLDENSNDESNRNSLTSSPTNFYEDSTLADNDLTTYIDNSTNYRYGNINTTAASYATSTANYRRANTSSSQASSISSATANRLSSNLFSPGSLNQPSSIFTFDTNNQDDFVEYDSNKSCCIECGAFAYLVKCQAHCDMQLCESCCEKHWQLEINELIKIKTNLENNVSELKKYLTAKKTQCNENIKSSQQIKKFINMTLQQIKRKVELELENKRDELFHSVDAFVENQKKISQSINEDTFQTADRICNEIENLLLMSENDNINLLKMKSLKSFARSCTQKMYQQKQSRIPLYSIFFVPDSTVQVNNSFGKIVLKSYDSEQESNVDFNDTASFLNGLASPVGLDEEFSFNFDSPLYQNNEFSFLNNNLYSNIDTSQVFASTANNKNRYLNNANNYQTSKYNMNDLNANNTASLHHRRSSSLNKTVNNNNQRYTASAASNRNYMSSQDTTNSIGMRATSNYLEQNRLSSSNHLETNSNSKESAYLPESYKELKSMSNNKLVVEEESVGSSSTSENSETKNEETLTPIKPFVPAKTLLAGQNYQHQQQVKSLSNQSTTTSATTNGSQIKEIKVTHKTPTNRFNSSGGETTTSASNSSNSSKESTPYSTTPSTPSATMNNSSITQMASGSVSASSFTASTTSQSGSNQQHQQQATMQKTFKQQLLSQGPKLVNF